jgi:hypothetical protein
MDEMLNIGNLIGEYQALRKRLESAVHQAPEGSIYYRKNAHGFLIPYQSRYGEKGRIHRRIGQNDPETIQALQRKRYAKKLLPKVDSCLRSLRQMKTIPAIDLYKEAAELGPQYRSCAEWASECLHPVSPAFKALKERQNPYPFENGYVDTTLVRFRSKGEALDAKILDEAGVSFLYEPAILLGNKVFYPDFAVDLYWKQMIGIIEHDGLLDDPQYRARKLNDLNRWIAYGYYPGINLLILSDHPAFGYDEVRIRKQLRAFCLP